jgi:hypothetical protein
MKPNYRNLPYPPSLDPMRDGEGRVRHGCCEMGRGEIGTAVVR